MSRVSNTVNVFDAFAAKVARLEQCDFVQQYEKAPPAALVEWRAGKGWEQVYSIPTQESIDAVVLTLRLFLQDNDIISLNRLSALYSPPEFREFAGEFDEIRRIVNEFLDSPTNVAVEPTKPLTHRDVLHMFVYGDLAHLNQTHRQRLQDFSETPFAGILNVDFCIVLYRIIQLLCQLRDLTARGKSRADW